MDIVELLRTVDALASTINLKTQELDRLKNDYNRKLGHLNKLLEDLRPASGVVNVDEVMSMIESEVKCPKCHEKVWDNNQADYLLLPKKAFELVGVEGKEGEKLASSTQQGQNQQNQQSQPNQQSPSHQQTSPPWTHGRGRGSHQLSKKTCSYCHKQGHLRARCFQRLNGT